MVKSQKRKKINVYKKTKYSCTGCDELKIDWKRLAFSILISIILSVPLTNHLLNSYKEGIEGHNKFLEKNNLTGYEKPRRESDTMMFLLIGIGFFFFCICVSGFYIILGSLQEYVKRKKQ